MNSRLVYVDYLRAFAMLYIVGYWHLFNYTDAFPLYMNVFTNKFTEIILGLFVLISGYLFGSKRNKTVTLFQFYKARVLKLYPLYAFSLLLFFLFNLTDMTTLLKSMVFLSIFHGPLPPTLWFIVMIFFFYLICPILIRIAHTPTRFVIATVAILVLLLACSYNPNYMDPRVAQYFPCFATGIYLGYQQPKLSIGRQLFLLLLFFGAAFLSLQGSDYQSLRTLAVIPMVTLGAVFALSVGDTIDQYLPRLSLVGFISYISFSMYLIHRPVFITMKSLFFPDTAALQIGFLYIVCLPMIALIAWLQQAAFDHITGKRKLYNKRHQTKPESTTA